MRRSLCLILSVIVAAVLQGCGVPAEGTVDSYLTALKANEFDKALTFVSSEWSDRFKSSFQHPEREQVAKAYFSLLEFKTGETAKQDGSVRVQAEITLPDYQAVIDAVTKKEVAAILGAPGTAVLSPTEAKARFEKGVIDRLKDPSSPRKTTTETFILKKVDGSWKIASGAFADGRFGTGIERATDLAKLQSDIQAARDEITQLEQDAEKAADGLLKFEVQRSQYYWQKGYILDEPIIEMTVKNATDKAVSRAYFKGTVFSPGRSVPWVEKEFNYEIKGGIEPGETQTWHLAPNSFSEWGDVPKDRNDLVMKVTVMRLDGADKQPIFESGDAERTQARLGALKERLAVLEIQLKAMTGE